MPFRFLAAEPVPLGILRIAREEIDGARTELLGHDDVHGRVHEARKHMKMLRALLRLDRGDLGSTYKAENDAIRDVARLLSAIRDAAVVSAAFDKLEQHRTGGGEAAFPPELGSRIHDMLATERDDAVRSATGEEGASTLHEAIGLLDAAADRVISWPLTRDGFGPLEEGLRKAYAGSRDGLVMAASNGSDGAFHEWRKRVKDLWYQMRLLEEPGAGLLDDFRGSLKDLADFLGDHHDLALLRARIVGMDVDVEPVVNAIAARQRQLGDEGMALGRRLFAEKPGAFVKRAGSYWRIWRTA